MILIKENKKGCQVQIEGTTSELLSELTCLIDTLLEDESVNENLIDVAVGLGKAKAKGTVDEYMKNTLKDIMAKAIDKMADDIKQEESEDSEND